MLGSIAGTLIACLSAWGLTYLFKLDGGNPPYIVPLLSQSAMQIDTRSLYIGMMFLANTGTLMDLSMDISYPALMKSGLPVGRGMHCRCIIYGESKKPGWTVRPTWLVLCDRGSFPFPPHPLKYSTSLTGSPPIL